MMNLCLIFGYHAVIGASSFDGVCEYTRFVLSAASDRALATGSLPLTSDDLAGMQELFFDVCDFAISEGKAPAIHQLEAGSLSRGGFIKDAMQEFTAFASHVRSHTEGGKYRAFGDAGFFSALKELYDPENILCVIEKTPLRKNVLNLIHFLRTKFQDVKVGIVCNNWEAEGTYVANTMAARRTGMPVFIPGTCPQEYREANDTFRTNRFTTNGLFDVVVQSYIEKERKPSDYLLKQAIEGLSELSATPEDAGKSRVFVFEGRANNVGLARKVAGVAKAYHIGNGATDVYKAVCDALKEMGSRDPRWNDTYAQLTRVIGPLFTSYPAEGWRLAEISNSDGNLLFLPPPIDSKVNVNEREIIGPFHRAIMSDLRDCLPQCFPLSDRELEGRGPIIGALAGPVLFERYRANIMPDAYRITLRTGSFIVRIEPKGGPKEAALVTLQQHPSIPKLVQAGLSYSQGGVPLAKIFRITKHLAEKTQLPVEEGLGFLASEVNSIGRDFFVQRYVDSRTIASVRELAENGAVRGYSQSRTKAQYTPSPMQFIDAALQVMVNIHSAPIPPDMESRAAALASAAEHPLLHQILELQSLCQSKNSSPPESLQILGRTLVSYLQKERGPTNPVICLTQRFVSLENYLFAHRSVDGNPQHPVEIVRVLNISSCDVGDPLLDVATLALMTKAPMPEGIVGLPAAVKSLFPTQEEIIDRYFDLAKTSGLQLPYTKEQAGEVLNVYQAASCFLRGCALFFGLRPSKISEGPEFARRIQAIERVSRLGVAVFSSVTAKGSTKPVAKL